MKNGVYTAKDEHRGYDLKVIVKESDKSYVLELLKNNSRFSPGHIDMMFAKSNKIRINKMNRPHAIIEFDDGFTIYPYRAGVPYYFENME